MKKAIFIFGSLAGALILLFEMSKFSLQNLGDTNDLFIIIAGCLFILIGFLINRFLSAPVTSQVHTIELAEHKSTDLLSKQEHKVLILMADGLSNMEIAGRLFISENTVKTHVSRVLSKLNAKRRTEAVKIGHDLGII